MITQKEFIKEHRKHLDKEFVKKYPKGQFVIQQRNLDQGVVINIYVNFRRRASHTLHSYPYGFGIEHSNLDPSYFVYYQNNSFDKIKIYKTLDSFLTACAKYPIKDEAITKFMFFYNNRNDKSFVKQVKKNRYFAEGICVFTVPDMYDKIWKD